MHDKSWHHDITRTFLIQVNPILNWTSTWSTPSKSTCRQRELDISYFFIRRFMITARLTVDQVLVLAYETLCIELSTNPFNASTDIKCMCHENCAVAYWSLILLRVRDNIRHLTTHWTDSCIAVFRPILVGRNLSVREEVELLEDQSSARDTLCNRALDIHLQGSSVVCPCECLFLSDWWSCSQDLQTSWFASKTVWIYV